MIHTSVRTPNHHIPLHPTPAKQGLLVLVTKSTRGPPLQVGGSISKAATFLPSHVIN